MRCPVVDLMITFRYGVPVYSWVNPEKKDKASNIGDSAESSSLISGLLSAILSFSESISSDTVVKQIKMATITYQYSVSDNLIFFIGYEADTTNTYETAVDDFLYDVIEHFNDLYKYQIGDDMKLAAQTFEELTNFLNENLDSDRWKIERTQDEILKEIKELLLDILGPMSDEIFKSNLKILRVQARGKQINLLSFAENLVGEISLLMDPAQAKQIGEEIKTLTVV